MFTKKETLLQNMAFMGIMAAINVLLCTLGAYLPITGIFVMIFLPFFSAIVTMLCRWKYYPIYAIATIGVSLCATLWNTEYTLFYLIPSVITGFLFGFCFSKKLNGTYAILLTSLTQLGLTYLMLPIIKGIYGTDLIYTFLTLFKLIDNFDYVMVIVPSFIYLLSLSQMVFSYIVLINEIKKFDTLEEKPIDKTLTLIGIGLAVLVIPFMFFAVNVSYLFMFIALFVSSSIIVNSVIERYKPKIVLNFIFLMFGFILVFALYSKINKPYAFLLIDTSNILILTFSLLYNLKRAKKVC